MRRLPGFAIIVVGLLAMLVLGACQPALSPVEVVEALEAAVEAKDVDAIVALYADDAVWHDGLETYTGGAEIRSAYEKLIELNSMDNTNIRVEGDKVLYDCYLINGFGQKWLWLKYEAVIENGQIRSNEVVETIHG